MNPQSDSSVSTAQDLAQRLSRTDPGDVAVLAGVRAALTTLAASKPAGVALLLNEAAAMLGAVIDGRAKDPASGLAAAIRFLNAGHVSAAPAPVILNAPPANPKSPASGDPTTFVIDEADRELAIEFVQEATDYVGQAEAAMLVLELSPDDNEAVDTVFRAFHTVKGVAAVLGLEPIAQLAHKAESLLSRVRGKEIRFIGRIADLSLASVDALKALIEGLQAVLAGESWVAPDLGELVHELVVATGTTSQGPASASEHGSDNPKKGRKKSKHKSRGSYPAPPPVYVPLDAVEGRSEPAIAIPLSSPSDAVSTIPALGASARPMETSESSLRVRTERLDRLVDMVGELVIAHSMVRQDPTVVGGGHHDLSRKISHAGKIVRELQELAMSLRMVPLKPTFQKMARVVRDTAQKSGKEVELVLAGEETEIDRNMVDVVADPLVHMLRNAVDHGIEAPAARMAAGKKRNGTVRLSATHAGGNVIVELADNGAGLDRARIVKKAVERGLIESDAGMSDGEVLNLIFEPGFSTVDKVTDLSGRGVGMDVVRRNVQVGFPRFR